MPRRRPARRSAFLSFHLWLFPLPECFIKDDLMISMIRRDNERIVQQSAAADVIVPPPQEGCWAHLVNPSWWSRAAAPPRLTPSQILSPPASRGRPRPVNDSQREASHSPRAGTLHSVDSRLESSGQHGAHSFYKPGRHLATREATRRPPAAPPRRWQPSGAAAVVGRPHASRLRGTPPGLRLAL